MPDSRHLGGSDLAGDGSGILGGSELASPETVSVLQPDDLQHSHALAATAITDAPLAPDALQHGHTLETTRISLSINALQHGHTLDATIITNLPVNDLQHGHTLENIVFELSPDSLQHAHLIEQTSLGSRLDEDDTGAADAVALPTTTSAHLVELEFWDGSSITTVRLTTAAEPIRATIEGTETDFTATGGLLAIGPVNETADKAGQDLEMRLSGLDSTVLDPMLAQHFRGREVSIWRVWLDQDTGAVDSGPLLLGRFKQLGAYEVTETPPEVGAPGTVEISTRVQSPLAALPQTNAVRTNVDSHNRMLERAGFTPPGGKDTFFQNVSAIVGKRIRWGSGDTPDTATEPDSWWPGSGGAPQGPGV